jgi:hypothetical protein
MKESMTSKGALTPRPLPGGEAVLEASLFALRD